MVLTARLLRWRQSTITILFRNCVIQLSSELIDLTLIATTLPTFVDLYVVFIVLIRTRRCVGIQLLQFFVRSQSTRCRLRASIETCEIFIVGYRRLCCCSLELRGIFGIEHG